MAGGYSKGNYKARVLQPEKFGVTPRAIHHIFELKRRAKSTVESKAYFVEIYNNKLRDLFFRSKGDNKKILEAHDKGLDTFYKYDKKKGKGEVLIKGNPVTLTIRSPEELLAHFEEACTNRIVARTNLNPESSRSHSILGIIVEKEMPKGPPLKGKLSLIDLAGSERVGKTGVTGTQFNEGTEINRSLSNLALVVRTLAEKEE